MNHTTERAKVEELRAVVRSLEWSGSFSVSNDGEQYVSTCPVCYGISPDYKHLLDGSDRTIHPYVIRSERYRAELIARLGHRANCRIARVRG